MAGIEKVCEYSGEYPGGDMYRYKHNLIQIMPKCRKLFRGAKHTLYIFKPEKYWLSKSGSCSAITQEEMNYIAWNYDLSFNNVQEFYKFYKEFYGVRIVNEHFYLLKVEDKNLLGIVQGNYLNWTTNISTVKRKLKRLLRCKKLNIVKIDKSYDDWEHY